MSLSLILNLSALFSLLPAAILAQRGGTARDAQFWILLGLAIVAAAGWSWWELADSWRTGLSQALWVSIATCLGLYGLVCLTNRAAVGLSALLMPYLVVLGLLATLSRNYSGEDVAGTGPTSWLAVHITVAVVTYGLITLAAVSGLAVFLQERALKAREPSQFGQRLPAVMQAERLEFRLLAYAELVLGAGIVTGMALQVYETNQALVGDHKTILSLTSFGVIGFLLLAHKMFGLRGRTAARVVLLAYLLLTLAYPGVKFVGSVILG